MSNHISRGAIKTTNGEETFIPLPAINDGIGSNHLKGMIDVLIANGWKELATLNGATGYMDCFEDEEPDAYGYDEYGRAFVQVNCLVEGKNALIRVFERYTDPDSVLVCSGMGLGPRVFGSALDDEEFSNFFNLAVNKIGFKQSAKYSVPLTVSLV